MNTKIVVLFLFLACAVFTDAAFKNRKHWNLDSAAAYQTATETTQLPRLTDPGAPGAPDPRWHRSFLKLAKEVERKASSYGGPAARGIDYKAAMKLIKDRVSKVVRNDGIRDKSAATNPATTDDSRASSQGEAGVDLEADAVTITVVGQGGTLLHFPALHNPGCCFHYHKTPRSCHVLSHTCRKVLAPSSARSLAPLHHPPRCSTRSSDYVRPPRPLRSQRTAAISRLHVVASKCHVVDRSRWSNLLKNFMASPSVREANAATTFRKRYGYCTPRHAPSNSATRSHTFKSP